MNRLSTPSNQRSISEMHDFIEKWLPARYTHSVNLILKDEKKDPAYIRQVKNRKTDDRKITDALYTVAKLNRLQVEK